LWERTGGAPDVPLTTRELANHWTIKAVTGLIARGLAGCDLTDTFDDVPASRRVDTGSRDKRASRDQKAALLLRPHARRIAKDVLRFGESILVMAEDSSGNVHELVPLPPDEVSREDNGDYKIGDATYAPKKILHIAEEVPAESPVEALRSLLEEDIEAQAWRKNAWKTAPRGLISRPVEADEWSEEAMERFSLSFLTKMRSAAFGILRNTGDGVPVLEEGMTWTDMPLPDAQSAQFIEARKLTAEAVASLYGVNGSLLATGEDRQLNQARRQMLAGPVADLGKLIGQCAQDQLTVRLYGSTGAAIRPTFDIQGALRAEDEDSGLTKVAVGKSWRTPNEQRALEGRGPIDGGDELAAEESKTVVTKSLDPPAPIHINVDVPEQRNEFKHEFPIIVTTEVKGHGKKKVVRDKAGLITGIEEE
jgi:HK97 family phage portal protein